MSTAVLVVAAVAALACPVHMLWRARGGRRANGQGETALTELGARRDALLAELSAREAASAPPATSADRAQ